MKKITEIPNNGGWLFFSLACVITGVLLEIRGFDGHNFIILSLLFYICYYVKKINYEVSRW